MDIERRRADRAQQIAAAQRRGRGEKERPAELRRAFGAFVPGRSRSAGRTAIPPSSATSSRPGTWTATCTSFLSSRIRAPNEL